MGLESWRRHCMKAQEFNYSEVMSIIQTVPKRNAFGYIGYLHANVKRLSQPACKTTPKARGYLSIIHQRQNPKNRRKCCTYSSAFTIAIAPNTTCSFASSSEVSNALNLMSAAWALSSYSALSSFALFIDDNTVPKLQSMKGHCC